MALSEMEKQKKHTGVNRRTRKFIRGQNIVMNFLFQQEVYFIVSKVRAPGLTDFEAKPHIHRCAAGFLIE
ncbi:hypothetical protein BpJC7_10750 [Weizmannia acidilactici]|uniref:Uncharacterized protein n=1 Tax=Weizmannia acidilactici TaxID=2607726 RepID=A0A5J4J448_9BACI|nr:hypothetical protein BpJC7_10750 [Weizmannia acidilactici]